MAFRKITENLELLMQSDEFTLEAKLEIIKMSELYIAGVVNTTKNESQSRGEDSVADKRDVIVGQLNRLKVKKGSIVGPCITAGIFILAYPFNTIYGTVVETGSLPTQLPILTSLLVLFSGVLFSIALTVWMFKS